MGFFRMQSTQNSVSAFGHGDHRGLLLCRLLESDLLSFPADQNSIPDGMFEDCTALTALTVNGTVSELGDYSFYGCTGLNTLTFGDRLKRIGRSAFGGCPLEQLSGTTGSRNPLAFLVLEPENEPVQSWLETNFQSAEDVNGDGTVSIAHVTFVLDALSNGKDVPDLDGDCVGSISDVTRLLDILAGAWVWYRTAIGHWINRLFKNQSPARLLPS